MALQGSFSGKTSNAQITPTITWQAVQSVTGNYSDITATLTYKRNNSYTTQGKWSGSLIIGSQTFTGSKTIKITNSSNAVAITATARVSHNDQGQLTLTLSATGAISGSTLSSTTISGEITLDTIARASTVSATDAYIERQATVVVNRKSTAFSHSIGYQLGSASGYIDAEGNAVTEETKFAATTVNFLLPESFYDQIPNAPSGTCTLTVRTYSGNTLIGQAQQTTFTATADPALCAPLVSGTAVDINEGAVALTGDNTKFINYVSRVKCQISATARNGASIKKLTVDGTDVTDTGVLEIPNIIKDKLVLRATDSRGYTATETLSLNLVGYILSTNNATIKRTDPTSGNAILTAQGNCWKGNFGLTENSIVYRYTVDGGEPSEYKALTIREDHTYYDQITLTGLDYTKSHTVKVTIYDQIRSVERTLTVQKGIPVFDWGEEDFTFHVPVEVPALTIGGVSLEAYIQGIIKG